MLQRNISLLLTCSLVPLWNEIQFVKISRRNSLRGKNLHSKYQQHGIFPVKNASSRGRHTKPFAKETWRWRSSRLGVVWRWVLPCIQKFTSDWTRALKHFGILSLLLPGQKIGKWWWSSPALGFHVLHRAGLYDIATSSWGNFLMRNLNSMHLKSQWKITQCVMFCESGFLNTILFSNYWPVMVVVAPSVCPYRERPFALNRESKWICWFSLQSWAKICIS